MLQWHFYSNLYNIHWYCYRLSYRSENEGGYHQNLEYMYTATSPQPMLQFYQSSKYVNI